MGRVIKLNKQQEKFIEDLEARVESNLDYYRQQYPPNYLKELEYLVNEGFHHSLANAIAEDLFFSSDMQNIEVFERKTKKMKVASV